MIYRFLLNNKTIDRSGEVSAKRFAVSVPADTPIIIIDGEKAIDHGKVEDFWEVSRGSCQERIMNRLTKK